jgi:hypothetical protein
MPTVEIGDPASQLIPRSDAEFDEWGLQAARRLRLISNSHASMPGTAQLPNEAPAPAATPLRRRSPRPAHESRRDRGRRARWSRRVPARAIRRPLGRIAASAGAAAVLVGGGALALRQLSPEARPARPASVDTYASRDLANREALLRSLAVRTEQPTGRPTAARHQRPHRLGTPHRANTTLFVSTSRTASGGGSSSTVSQQAAVEQTPARQASAARSQPAQGPAGPTSLGSAGSQCNPSCAP